MTNPQTETDRQLAEAWQRQTGNGTIAEDIDGGWSVYDYKFPNSTRYFSTGFKDGKQRRAEPPKPGSYISLLGTTAANDNNPLPFVDPSDWHGKPVPTREWFLDGLIPRRQVTILNGDGGVGKSLLALQVAAASAMGCETIGLLPMAGRVMYLGAEDEADEFHRRLDAITHEHHRHLSDLADFRLVPMADRDALLAVPDKIGVMQPTENMVKLVARLVEFRPSLLVLDTSADLFGGDEIKRNHVRQFIGLLRKPAIELDMAVLLLSHPSVAGMQSGTGSSGSTAWNNSVRSRLYLTRPEGKDDADPDTRILTTMKSNYGKKGAEIRMRWHEGAFVLDDGKPSPVAGILNKRADETFVEMLSKLNQQGQKLSPSPSVTYAPKIIAAHADANGLTAKQLAAAQQRLLDKGDVRIVEEGPPSRRYRRLLVSSEIYGEVPSN
ncbi:AAA family ATPase [Mesorhizobium huakuii 7653R]|nr:AAA family ATPase [Mesorhizobium huakuii 7653R]